MYVEPDKVNAGPWEYVGTDLFHWNNHDYLLVIDYYSNYPEIAISSSKSSENVILNMRSIFARHGAPKVLTSDNGPQYTSESFKSLQRDMGSHTEHLVHINHRVMVKQKEE